MSNNKIFCQLIQSLPYYFQTVVGVGGGA